MLEKTHFNDSLARLLVGIIAACLFASLSFSQTKNIDDQPVKVETLLVNLPVIASDRDGRNIPGLTKEDFTVTENGEKLPIEFFANDEAPINVAIVVDTSGSTQPIMSPIKKAAKTFLSVLRSEDKVMVVSFDGKFQILSELTADQKKLKNAVNELMMIQSEGSYMYDAIEEVINKKFAAIKGRKAIILLTDGMVEGKRISKQQLTRTLTETDTVIYPILFLTQAIPKNSPSYEYLGYLQMVAGITAGRIFYAGSDLQKAFQSIADEMKSQYLIGFYPQPVETGRPRDIKINVNRENIVVRTKRSFRLKDAPPDK